jgi:thiosulfate oxidation carrier complex protein SoxZ
VLAAVWNKAAFQADSLSDAEKSLSINQEIPSEDIEVVVPSRAENGAIVQIAVHSHIPNTEAIAILVEKNPTTLIGNYLFYPHAIPKMVTRIKMAETSAIKVIVKSGNQYFTTSKNVGVLENGCGGSSSKNEKFISSMKLRAKLLAEHQLVEMKAIITHPMHTGLGKDESGQFIPAHFIQLITIKHNENPIIEMQLGTGISKNPYLTFYLKGLNVGDQLVVAWQDNQGLTGQDLVVVTQV